MSIVWSDAYADPFWAGVRNIHLILTRSPHTRFSSSPFDLLAPLQSMLCFYAAWFGIKVLMIRRPFRIPLSAFIVEDMAEFVQAHASYRFIISDEEDERPRILVRTVFHSSCRLYWTLWFRSGYSSPTFSSRTLLRNVTRSPKVVRWMQPRCFINS